MPQTKTTAKTALLLTLLAGCPSAMAQQEPIVRPAAPVQPERDAAAMDHAPEAVEVLKAVAEAVREGYAAEVRCYAEGAIAGFFPKAEGRWSQRTGTGEDGVEGEENWAARYSGQATAMTRSEPLDFDVLWLPDRVAWIDHENEMYFERRPQGNRGAGEAYMLPSSAWNQAKDLVLGFREALSSAASIEMAEPAEVDGVPCDVVAIRAEQGSDPTYWYFGRDDRLPRRNEIRLPENENFSGAIRVDFTDGRAGAQVVSAQDFKLFPPDSYGRDLSPIFQDPAARAEMNTPMPGAEPEAGVPPEWSAEDTEGRVASPESLRGSVAVLYFWGTWSPASAKAVPALSELAKEFEGQPVEFLGMAFREGEPEKVGEAAREQGQTWRIFPEADEAVKLMNIRSAPSFVVLGPQGELLLRSGRPRGDDYGALTEQIRGVITRALEAAPADGQRDASEAGTGERVGPRSVTPVRRPKIKTRDD